MATENTNKPLRDYRIQCQAIHMPMNVFDLCARFQRGKCPFSIGCDQKHALCVEPMTCKNTYCWYGHDAKRKIRSAHRPASSN